jgi:hypothetical protein
VAGWPGFSRSAGAPVAAAEARASELGAYLTDGRRLFRVLDSREIPDAAVLLEDCAVRDCIGEWVRVQRVLETMRVVVPKR